MNYLEMLLSALGQGLLYAPAAMGVYIAFRILNTADLTIDGSFVFGMTVCAVITVAGYPVLAIPAGMAAGAIAGWVTGILQTSLEINPILSGILTMTGLYTINYMVLGGQANLYLQRMTTGENGAAAPKASMTIYRMFSQAFERGDNYTTPVLSAMVSILAAAALIVFFKTRSGMAIRATGDNEEMVRSSSINAGQTRRIGIMIANAMVGLSGALLCQQQRYADLSSGNGTLIVGLASVIIGLAIFRRRSVTPGIISAIVGSVIYRIIIQASYLIDMPSYMVKLLSAVVVVFALSLPLMREKIAQQKIRRRGRRAVV
jgi:putative ABC transport system permease protein